MEEREKAQVWYYETMSITGKWCANLSSTMPTTKSRNGVQVIDSLSHNMRVRRIKQVWLKHAKKSLNDLIVLYGNENSLDDIYEFS